MPHRSRWTIDIPKCSFPTLLFKSATEPLSDTPAFYDASRPETHFLTRQSFRLWSQRFAKGLLKSKHFKKGDRVLIFSPNDFFFPVVFLGTLIAGGIFTGANPTYTPRELAHQIRDSGATYVLCSELVLDTGIAAAKEAGLLPDRVLIYNTGIYDGHDAPGTFPQKGCQYWGNLVASAEESKDLEWDSLEGPEECHNLIALNYSSGTTGLSKGVMITHYNYVANTLQFWHIAQLNPDYEARNKRAVWLCFLPMYHAMAQTIFIAGGFARQIPVYVMTKFDFLQVLEYVQKYRVTDFTLVPPIAVALAKHPAVRNYDLSSVENIGSGSAPLGRDVSAQVEALWPNRKNNMKQGWGMTEVTCSLLGWDPTKISNDNAVGEPNANCEAMIVSEDTNEEVTARGPEARGELWCRAPNVMKGYWRNQKATDETFAPGGWLKTGDIAYVDEHGHFFIVDRKKELIKVKANQVAPAELEALLLEHPSIADAAVIGMPTPDGDEAPRAFVVLQPDEKSQAMKEEEVVAFVKDKVAHYKRLTGGATFIEAVPKNPSGKILRRQLRDQYKTKDGQAKL